MTGYQAALPPPRCGWNHTYTGFFDVQQPNFTRRDDHTLQLQHTSTLQHNRNPALGEFFNIIVTIFELPQQ